MVPKPQAALPYLLTLGRALPVRAAPQAGHLGLECRTIQELLLLGQLGRPCPHPGALTAALPGRSTPLDAPGPSNRKGGLPKEAAQCHSEHQGSRKGPGGSDGEMDRVIGNPVYCAAICPLGMSRSPSHLFSQNEGKFIGRLGGSVG